jgi:hypothetical protein
MLSLRGLALAQAINSGTVVVGTDGVYHHDVGTSEDARDRRDVADKIEIEVVVERRVDRD